MDCRITGQLLRWRRRRIKGNEEFETKDKSFEVDALLDREACRSADTRVMGVSEVVK